MNPTRVISATMALSASFVIVGAFLLWRGGDAARFGFDARGIFTFALAVVTLVAFAYAYRLSEWDRMTRSALILPSGVICLIAIVEVALPGHRYGLNIREGLIMTLIGGLGMVSAALWGTRKWDSPGDYHELPGAGLFSGTGLLSRKKSVIIPFAMGISALVVVIGAFLGWSAYFVPVDPGNLHGAWVPGPSRSGIEVRDGLITLALAVVTLVVFAQAYRLSEWNGITRSSLILLSCVICLIAIDNIYKSSPGAGAYLTLIGGLGLVAVSLWGALTWDSAGDYRALPGAGVVLRCSKLFGGVYSRYAPIFQEKIFSPLSKTTNVIAILIVISGTLVVLGAFLDWVDYGRYGGVSGIKNSWVSISDGIWRGILGVHVRGVLLGIWGAITGGISTLIMAVATLAVFARAYRLPVWYGATRGVLVLLTGAICFIAIYNLQGTSRGALAEAEGLIMTAIGGLGMVAAALWGAFGWESAKNRERQRLTGDRGDNGGN